ncbi:MAG: flagellar basal-body MS-ring/collar protein FliF [Actinomycetota bacterium]|nr:flagellar basal-body MS-ring/collar protein FliF [Actinomycetota bacterium]
MALVPANDQFNRLRDGAKQFAGGFTAGQKAVTIAAVAAVLIGAVLFMSMSGKPTYAPLFTNVQPTDAANITAKLTSESVPFQLANGGTTIMVPANDVATQRLAMAQAGLPAQSTVGLSLLDKEGITASNMTQQADYLRALQGELEQTIDAISGVSSSQVTIALPANQSFAVNTSAPTGASVLVTMVPGQTLSSQEVQAIVHLVGSSVPNLNAQQVTVADSNGNLLAGPGVAAGGGSNNATQSYDSQVQGKVQAYLAAVLGQNNADVQVNATLNYDQINSTTQTIVPAANGKPASFCTQTSTSTQTYTGTGAPPGGVAGAITPTTGTGTGNYNQSSGSQTCETNQQTITDQQAPGTVKSQSVAVLVNTAALPKGVSMAQLQAGVAAAAGINAARGDTLAFSAMPFSTAASKQAAKAAAAAAAAGKSKSLMSEAKVLVVVLAVLVALFLLWRSARKARTAVVMGPMSATDALSALSMPVHSSEPTGQLPAVSAADVSGSVEAATVNTFIDAQPDDVASMLRSWLSDNRTQGPG